MKRLLLYIILLLSFTLCFTNKMKAQLDSSSFSFGVELVPDLRDFSGTDTSYFHKINLNLLDTVNVSKIAVKIGTSDGLGDIESYDFLFDEDTFLPEGYAYYRNRNEVHLTLNEHLARVYYFEVKLIDTNGIGTIPKKWNTWNQ